MRTATLFNRSYSSSPALANAGYPTALSAALSEEQVYHPGLYDLYPATAKIARGGAGVTSKLKFQGTTDMPDPLLLGDSFGRISLIAIDSGQSVQLAQATGASVSTTASAPDAAGLTTITLGTDARGRGNVTAQALSDYIAANLPAIFTSVVVVGGGIMGAMTRAAAVPQAPRWVDIPSIREDTATEGVEHTVDAGLGGTSTIGFQVKTKGFRAIRCIATGTAAPASGDSVLVQMGLPG